MTEPVLYELAVLKSLDGLFQPLAYSHKIDRLKAVAVTKGHWYVADTMARKSGICAHTYRYEQMTEEDLPAYKIAEVPYII